MPLSLYNYTEKTQFEHYWTPETTICRGLILDDAGAIVARPFPKFFNIEERGADWTPPAEPFQVTAKLDGSLGISYATPDGLAIATRGSFTSEQAEHATHIWRSRYRDLPWEPARYTYLWEVIYPENRIVVDYHGLDDLVLLAVIDTATGDDLPLPDWFPNRVRTYDGVTDLSAIRALGQDNEEGFVVRFQSGQRVKIKLPEYVRLHRLVTGVTARSIWDLLAHGQGIDELLQRAPEEFESWVKATAAALTDSYQAIERQARAIFDQVAPLPTRKEQALHPAMQHERALTGIVFCMLDGKPYAPSIWKMIKPAADRPFTQEDDA